jgi:hypothetical protein
MFFEPILECFLFRHTCFSISCATLRKSDGKRGETWQVLCYSIDHGLRPPLPPLHKPGQASLSGTDRFGGRQQPTAKQILVVQEFLQKQGKKRKA